MWTDIKDGILGAFKTLIEWLKAMISENIPWSWEDVNPANHLANTINGIPYIETANTLIPGFKEACAIGFTTLTAVAVIRVTRWLVSCIPASNQ